MNVYRVTIFDGRSMLRAAGSLGEARAAARLQYPGHGLHVEPMGPRKLMAWRKEGRRLIAEARAILTKSRAEKRRDALRAKRAAKKATEGALPAIPAVPSLVLPEFELLADDRDPDAAPWD